VDLSQLQLFRDIVQTRSISQGASQNGITQSAASQAVQELERQFAARLLDRSHRPLEVTQAGWLFYEFCRDVMRRKREFETELERLVQEPGGVLRVASIYSVGISEMARLEGELRRLLPAAHLEVDYLRPERVYEAVLDDRADLGLVSYPESRRDLVVLPWREETMVLAAAPAHPLAALETIAADQLEGWDLISFDRELPISRDIERYLRDHGVKLNVVMRFDNIQSMKEALLVGKAVSILPEPMLRADVEENRLRAIPLRDSLRRPLGVIHRRKKSLPRPASVFLSLLREAAG
jgi:DNA-binding transcriptional LysR family regulator